MCVQVILTRNSARDGGAIFIEEGAAELWNRVQVVRNQATRRGGAAYLTKGSGLRAGNGTVIGADNTCGDRVGDAVLLEMGAHVELQQGVLELQDSMKNMYQADKCGDGVITGVDYVISRRPGVDLYGGVAKYCDDGMYCVHACMLVCMEE
jgi:hypothetical protein